MLAERQYLWLCELARTGLITSQHTGHLQEIVQALQQPLAERKQGDLAMAILGSSQLACLELTHRGQQGGTRWHIFVDQENRQGIVTVSVSSNSMDGKTYLFSLDEMAHVLQDVLADNVHYVLSGIGHGGWQAAVLADALGTEAVVFGVSTMDELPGKSVNYVGEHELVGDHTEKVFFVKQQGELGTVGDDFLYRRLAFEEDGKAVVSEQSEFSRFVSWFYRTAGTIDPEVWNIFFPGSDDEETMLFADPDIHFVFLKAADLNKEKFACAIKETVQYTAAWLGTNRSLLTAELEKLTDEDYEDLVSRTVEKYMEKASEYVQCVSESVRTVFMGVALLSSEQGSWDMDSPIHSFHEKMLELLDQELEQMKKCLDQAIARRLKSFFQMPLFDLVWEDMQ
jgi:hypothetical protein